MSLFSHIFHNFIIIFNKNNNYNIGCVLIIWYAHFNLSEYDWLATFNDTVMIHLMLKYLQVQWFIAANAIGSLGAALGVSTTPQTTYMYTGLVNIDRPYLLVNKTVEVSIPPTKILNLIQLKYHFLFFLKNAVNQKCSNYYKIIKFLCCFSWRMLMLSLRPFVST